MIPIKKQKRALGVTRNDNQKRFVVCLASTIRIALLQNGLHVSKVWPPYMVSHQVDKIVCPLFESPWQRILLTPCHPIPQQIEVLKFGNLELFHLIPCNREPGEPLEKMFALRPLPCLSKRKDNVSYILVRHT